MSGLGGVESAKLANDHGAVGVGPRDVLRVGRFRLIFVAEPSAGGVNADRPGLLHAPAQNVDEVDAVIAEFAVAEVPEPVPVVVDEILVIGLHRGGSEPQVPVQP